jgi:hypothetical protein
MVAADWSRKPHIERTTTMLPPNILELRGARWWERRRKRYPPPRTEPLKVFSSKEAYVAHLERHGFERIGGGYYGRVYAKPGSPWVLKIGYDPEDGWPAYARMVMKLHPSNPYAPRIKSLRWHEGGKQPFYVAVMERLGHTIQDIQFRDHEMGRLFYRAGDAMRGWGYPYGDLDPALVGLTMDIRHLAAQGGQIDFHNENAMVDLTGTRFVITDPLGHSSINTRGQRRYRAAA